MAYIIIIALWNASFLYENGEFCLFWWQNVSSHNYDVFRI